LTESIELPPTLEPREPRRSRFYLAVPSVETLFEGITPFPTLTEPQSPVPSSPPSSPTPSPTILAKTNLEEEMTQPGSTQAGPSGQSGEVQTTTETTKEIKMNPPTAYSGDRKKLDEFLMEVEMYLRMNQNIYQMNEQKIIFALSFMKEGTAGPWKQSYFKEYIGTDKAQTWEEFKTLLKSSFSAVDKEGDAITKMMTSKQGSATADEFIEEFKIWASESGVTQDRPLIEWFMLGLNNELRNTLLRLENPPTTIVNWYKKASEQDNNFRKYRSITNRSRGNFGFKPQERLRFSKPKERDPNAMDVDRLNDQQREEHYKKGLCFKCHQHGHRANACPNQKRAYTPTAPPAKTFTSAHAQIKVIYDQLNENEQKKLLDKFEETGF
jgi:hypothetical protein